MSFKIESLDRLIASLSRLPGIGEKTAQRLAFFILQTKTGLAEQLSQALVDVKLNVKSCRDCFSYTDQELCEICRHEGRKNELLCVVEDPSDILRIESAMGFKGKYHVLQGVLSPLDGIGPDQVRLSELILRIQKGGIAEVILALDADLEGDATCIYISNLLKPMGVKVSRIAQGVPIGGNLDYVDSRTLNRALENRTQL